MKAAVPGPSAALLQSAAVLLFLGASFAGTADEHDLWIRPSTFTAQQGELLQLALRLGDLPEGEVVPRVDSLLIRFDSHGPRGRVLPVPGIEGLDPAGILRPDEAGLWTLIYEGRPVRSELPPSDFEGYLEEEGLESVLEQRQQRGEGSDPGVELYSRSLKTLVVVGDARQPLADRAVGLPLELVVENDLGRWRPGQPLRLRLLYEGAPLAGALVDFTALDGGGEAHRLRSADDGSLELAARPGAWVAAVVHMVRDDSGIAQWRSFFHTLTLELGVWAAR